MSYSDTNPNPRPPYHGLDFRDFIDRNRTRIRLFALLVLATIAFGERINLWPSPIDFLTAVSHHRQGRYEEAAERFRALADAGHVRAKYNLAIMLIDGVGVEQDRRAATELLFEAAKRGHDESRRLFFTHSVLYDTRFGTMGLSFYSLLRNETGVAKVIHYYIRNFAPASIYRGFWNDAGFLRTVGSYTKPRKHPRFGSIPLLHKERYEALLQGVETGAPEAMFELAIRHLAVMGVPHNEALAVDLLIEAERLGHDAAHELLNEMTGHEAYASRYSAQMESRNNKRNRLFEIAPEYFTRAQAGEADAQIYLALMLSQGYGGVVQNKERALELLRNSVQDIDTRELGPLLAAVSSHTHRTPVELEVLAASGDPAAQYLLAARIASETNEDDRAFGWLQQAAKYDEGNLYYALGVFATSWPYASDSDYALMQRLRGAVERGDTASYNRLLFVCRPLFFNTAELRYACLNVDGFGNPCAQPWASRSRE